MLSTQNFSASILLPYSLSKGMNLGLNGRELTFLRKNIKSQMDEEDKFKSTH